MNEDRIVQALQAYQGTEDSLNATIPVLAEELGPNWTETVFEQLGGLPVDLKEKLNHAFNYYAALTAWQEAQSYLEQTTPLDATVQERLPVLKHWLDFFGEAGMEIYQQLEQKMNDTQVAVPEETPKEQNVPQPSVSEENNAETQKQETPVAQKTTADSAPDSGDAFLVQKARKEIDLLNAVQAWLSARCLQLNNMEVFVYPYYGFAVDLMRQTAKDIQAALDVKDKAVLAQFYEGGEEALSRKKQAVEADIETAVQNCESATTALIDENINMDEVRKTLGNLDESAEREYLGPAPDGFELVQEDNAPLDEAAVREQYQQLEQEVLEI